MPHTVFVTCRNPISLFIHVFTNRKKKKFVSDCLTWNMNSVFCVNYWGKDLNFTDAKQKESQSHLLALTVFKTQSCSNVMLTTCGGQKFI